MHTVEVSKNGAGLGTVDFLGITSSTATVAAPPVLDAPKRRYKCTPTKCVPKAIARRIANNLSSGVQAGQEDDYVWHT